jgi:N-acetyl sugar amidotransferase
MIRCTQCVMPDTRPDSVFIKGICPACINAKKKVEIDWEARDKELDQLLDRFHGECIVPSSGGKDSFRQALYLLDKGADITAVTARTCHLTEIGRKNIDNMAKYVRTVEYVPNMTVRAKMNKIGLQMVGDISLPEHIAIFTTPFRASIELNTPLIIYGENPQNAYGGKPGSESAKEMTLGWMDEFGGTLGVRDNDFVGLEGITERDMRDYSLPLKMDVITNKTEAHFLGAYIPWDSHENAKVAAEHGMIQELPTPANYWAHENQDNGQCGVHCYFMFLKFGFGRGCSQISVDIRNGLISREDALKWVEEHDGLEPTVYAGVTLEEVLDHIGMGMKEYRGLVEQFRIDHAGP